jgi:hypothetical protein
VLSDAQNRDRYMEVNFVTKEVHFLACVPSWEATKVQRQANQKANLAAKWAAAPWSSSLYSFLSSCLFLLFLLPVLHFSAITNCGTAS